MQIIHSSRGMTERLYTTALKYTDYAVWDHLWVWEGGLPVNMKLNFSNDSEKILLISANCGGVHTELNTRELLALVILAHRKLDYR